MFREEINQATDDLSNLTGMHPTDLKLLAERYPYCQVAQLLYAKKLHYDQHPAFEKQLQKTSAIIYDRSVLFNIIEKTPLQQQVAAGFDHEETIVQDIQQETHEIAEIKEIEKPVMIDEHLTEETLQEFIREEELQKQDLPTEDHRVTEITNEIPEYKEPVEEIMTAEPEETNNTEEIPVQEEMVISDEEIVVHEEEDHQMEMQTDTPVLEEEPVEEIRQLPVVEKQETPAEELSVGETDEPIFELPGYQIEQVLGKLDESEEIRIDIRRPDLIEDEPPVEEEEMPVPMEQQSYSFSGWLKAIAGESKGRVVEMRTVNRPKQLYKTEVVAEDVKPVVEKTEDYTEEITEDVAGELARKSIEPDDSLVTETYARILYMQGKINKAIEVYEQLSLKKPEKSDYFAALIEQLKKRR